MNSKQGLTRNVVLYLLTWHVNLQLYDRPVPRPAVLTYVNKFKFHRRLWGGAGSPSVLISLGSNVDKGWPRRVGVRFCPPLKPQMSDIPKILSPRRTEGRADLSLAVRRSETLRRRTWKRRWTVCYSGIIRKLMTRPRETRKSRSWNHTRIHTDTHIHTCTHTYVCVYG